MDIYAKPGTKVKYLGKNGYDAERERAKEFLEVGAVLTVKEIDVHSWVSYALFEEVPGVWFNTVMFEEVEDSVSNGITAMWDDASYYQELAIKYNTKVRCDNMWPYGMDSQHFEELKSRSRAERELEQKIGDLEQENANLLAANKDLQLHWDVLKADYDNLVNKVNFDD